MRNELFSPTTEKILLVEDAQGFARIVIRLLEKAGLSAEWVETGEAALQWLQGNKPCLMLLDYALPDMSGRDLVETLHGNRNATPFIIITGGGDERVAVDMMKLGALDYLVKDESFLTFFPSVLRQALNRLETQRRLLAAEEKLEERQKHLQAFAAALPDMVFVLDKDGCFVEILSDQHCDEFSVVSFKGKRVEEVFGAENAVLFREAIQQTLTSRTSQIVEYSLVTPCGSAWFEGRTAPVGLQQPLVVWVAREISARKKSEEDLRKLTRAIEQSPNMIMVTDAEGRIEYVNPAFSAITGYSAEEVEGRPPSFLRSNLQPEEFYQNIWGTIASGSEWRGEFCISCKSGNCFWEHAVISPVKDQRGHITHYLKVSEDMTARKTADAKIHSLTYYDSLTGLPNQILFRDRLVQAMAAAHRNDEKVGVVVVDLDQFQRINNAFAHDFGDQLLRQVGARLQQTLRDEDTVARFWGDSFLLALPDLRKEEDLLRVAYKLIGAFAPSFRVEEREVFLTASLGLALYPSDGASVEALLRNAESALARCKEQGPNSFQMYAPSMNLRASESLMLQGDLRKALDRREFLLFYQPQLDVRTRKMVGVEALLRWQHPEFGLLAPDKFISMAEETNLICPLGEWAILEAFRQVALWSEGGLQRIQMSINLSPRQFHAGDCVSVIEHGIRKYGLEPSQLTFEITEMLLLKNTDQAVAALNRIKSLGCLLAIDDFGTGYSSLSYLQRFPLDMIKIDKSFVTHCDQNPPDGTICRTIIAMAKSLGLRVLAEGVEREEHCHFLEQNGCHEMQGFLFGRPLSVDKFNKLWLRGRP